MADQPEGLWVWVRYGIGRAVMFAFLWYVITEGELLSWVVGVPTVMAATLASVTLLPPLPWRWRFSGLVRFLPYFLMRSVRGSIDVARRALHPLLPLAPLLVEYPLRLQDSLARVFLVNTISLLPGTLSAELHGDRLIVHALDGSPTAISAQLEFSEGLVADLFGVELPESIGETGASHA